MNNIINLDGKEYLRQYDDGNMLRLIPLHAEPEVTIHDPSSSGLNSRRISLPEDSTLGKRDNADDDDNDDEEDDDEDEGDDDKRNEKAPAAKKLKKARVYWKENEVEKLLDIVIEKHIVAKMDGKFGKLRHDKIFKSVAKALNQAGLGEPKTAKRCKTKFRKLRETFTECEKHNNTSGKERKECQFYAKLAIIFSKRPKITSASWGYDSGHEQQGMNRSGDEDSLSLPATSDTADGDTTPKTTPKTSGAKKFPPKYRSGKNISTALLLKDLLEKEEKEAKLQREWAEEQSRKQEERDERLINGLMTTMTAGLENIANMFMQQSTPPPPQFVLPTGNSWNVSGPSQAFAQPPPQTYTQQPQTVTSFSTPSTGAPPASIPSAQLRPASTSTTAPLSVSHNSDVPPRNPAPRPLQTITLRQADGRVIKIVKP